jgi:hypothetical protein
MPDAEDMIEWYDDFLDWFSVLGNEAIIGLIIALGLVIWIWRGRGRNNDIHPA